MKLLVWLCAVLVQLVGLELALSTASAWRWLWLTTLVLWFLYGLVLAMAHAVTVFSRRVPGSIHSPFTPPKGDK